MFRGKYHPSRRPFLVLCFAIAIQYLLISRTICGHTFFRPCSGNESILAISSLKSLTQKCSKGFGVASLFIQIYHLVNEPNLHKGQSSELWLQMFCRRGYRDSSRMGFAGRSGRLGNKLGLWAACRVLGTRICGDQFGPLEEFALRLLLHHKAEVVQLFLDTTLRYSSNLIANIHLIAHSVGQFEVLETEHWIYL